jgi:phage protein U
MFMPGAKFLHKRDSRLHTSKEVEKEQKRQKRKGEKPSNKPEAKLENFLKIIERTHTTHRGDKRRMGKIKKYYHDQHVIKPEDVPESYFDLQRKIARERGQPADVGAYAKERLTEVIVADQRSTLNNWVDYFTSPHSDSFPMWAKYWAFKGMLKLGVYDKEKKRFSKRTKETTAPFTDLNREALAYVVDALVKKVEKQQVRDDIDGARLKQLLGGASFGKLYAWALEKVTPFEQGELKTTTGEWVKFEQGSDHMPLVESIEGYGTGWCTAGEQTAHSQLQGGDFYVYYSHNGRGKAVNPRIAIHMQGDEISEVRGIANHQNMDPIIAGTDVLEEKLKEFGKEGEKFTKRDIDMKRLTEIERQSKEGEEISKEDLRFLYEIDRDIEGFGYDEDPRIQELLDEREMREDICFILDCEPEQVSTTNEEAFSGDMLFHYGDLNLRDAASVEGLTFPKHVHWTLWLSDVTSVKGAVLPDVVGGSLILQNLASMEGVMLPEKVGGNLVLNALTSAKGLKLPKVIGEGLFLRNLTSAEGLVLPDSVGEHIDLSGLTSADGLVFQEAIEGTLDLSGLTSAEGLVLPNSVGGSLSLSGLTSAEGLVLPEHIGGDLKLTSLTSAEGLVLPEHIGGNLFLSELTSAEDLELPKTVDGFVMFSKLTSAKGLRFPEGFRGHLDLNCLTSAEGLELPKTFRGTLELENLTSADNLVLPESIGGSLKLTSLTSADGLVFPKSIGGNLNLTELTSADNLVLPEHVGGNLDLSELTSADGLVFPKTVGGEVFISNICAIEGVSSLQSFKGAITTDGSSSECGSRIKEKYPDIVIDYFEEDFDSDDMPIFQDDDDPEYDYAMYEAEEDDGEE